MDRDDSDEISFTCSTTDVGPISSEVMDRQGSDPPDYQKLLSLGQSPVTSASGASTSSQPSLFLLRSDIAGLKEGNISDEVLNMT